MSAFENLASPAPQVEAANAARAVSCGELKVEPVRPSEDARVEAAQGAEPAVTFDDPKQFAPPMTKEQTSHLSVATLRGSGADFESKAAVLKGGVQRSFLRRALPLFFDERDFLSMGEVTRFVFVKGNCIFVYGQESDPSPLYAVQLETVRAIQEDPKKPDKDSFTISPRLNTNEAREHLVTILFKDRSTGKQAYQFTFDTLQDKSVTKRFLDVIQRNSKYYGNEVVTASVVRAKSVVGAISKH